MEIKNYIKNHQQKLALSVGYLLVFALAFGLGRITAYKYNVPEIRIEEVFNAPDNYTANVAGAQTETDADCAGKIKGNIGSKEKIYHLPGGSFYNRTNPEMCFNTEAEAKAAGFRRSSR